jgi:hypothetical protein
VREVGKRRREGRENERGLIVKGNERLKGKVQFDRNKNESSYFDIIYKNKNLHLKISYILKSRVKLFSLIATLS